MLIILYEEILSKLKLSILNQNLFLNRNCKGYIIPHLYQNETECKDLPEPTWKCTICNTTEFKNKINNILKKIAYDYSMTDKQDTISCEIFLNHYDQNQLLHPNHYFLNDVRFKLAQLYGQTIQNDIQSLTDAELERKIKLCRQSLEFATILYPGRYNIFALIAN